MHTGMATSEHRSLTVTVLDTALGPVGLACTAQAAVAVQLPERDEATTRRRLLDRLSSLDGTGRPTITSVEMSQAALAAAEVIRQLLAGGDADVTTVPVDVTGCSDFDQRVYLAVRAIPRGRTLTYGEVAEVVGEPGGAQAVGRAMAANPIPILVPCHRVLGAGKALIGFSAHGGVETKRRMLLIEGSTDVVPTLFDQLD